MNAINIIKFYTFIFVLMIFVQFSSAQKLKAHKKVENDSVYISFVNTFYAPIEVNFEALDSTQYFIKVNPYKLLKYKDTINSAIVIPQKYISDTTKINPSQYISFDGSFGNPRKIPDDSLYLLPYIKGKSYKIMQSFGGSFSHNSESSYYAIDFSMPIGDTVTAARSGKVFFVKEDSQEHCPTRKCMDKANKVLVLHSDGSYANYVHLYYNGALVKVGDEVKAGDIIGISGMTGFTTKPHLHFVVHKSRKASIPIYFEGLKRKKLKKGKTYTRRK